MMAVETLLLSLRSSSLLIIAFLVCHQYLFQTSLANMPNSCTPSSCGIIRNISYPFRLKDDPNLCGDRRFELTCESNVTSVSINSQKYYVKAINYSEFTIRLADASINNDDACSFPNTSAYGDTFRPGLYYHGVSQPINLMSCPHPLKNSSLVFTDITHDCASNSSSLPRFTYVKVGYMMASEVPQKCGIDLIVTTSWNKFMDSNSTHNLSLSEIHHSLLYGFELEFCIECRKAYTLGENVVFFFTNRWPLLIPLAIVVFLTAGVSLPLMIIIGFIGLLLLSLFLSMGWINENCYVAPELISRSIGAVSYKADVYSFGMLLMEMVSLKRDLIRNNGDSNQYFPYWIYDHFNQGKDIEIEGIDKNNEKDENDNMRKLARKMTKVALWCIQMSPNDRPSMNEVLKMLEGDAESVRIPDYPQNSIQFILNEDQNETTHASDSVPLLLHDDGWSSVDITVEE